jgi:hypothetical protein
MSPSKGNLIVLLHLYHRHYLVLEHAKRNLVDDGEDHTSPVKWNVIVAGNRPDILHDYPSQ